VERQHHHREGLRQEHFIDCAGCSASRPHEADPIGATYAFEKRVSKAAGGDGFADVWKRDCFAWEYKGRTKDLKAAYVSSSTTRTTSAIRRFSSSATPAHRDPHELHRSLPVLTTITLDDLAADDPSEALATLRALFADPEALRPHILPARSPSSRRATSRRSPRASARAATTRAVAHVLDRILFCLFAEDAGRWPAGHPVDPRWREPARP